MRLYLFTRQCGMEDSQGKNGKSPAERLRKVRKKMQIYFDEMKEDCYM